MERRVLESMNLTLSTLHLTSSGATDECSSPLDTFGKPTGSRKPEPVLLALGKSETEVKDRPLKSILNTKDSSSDLVIKMNKSIVDTAEAWEGEIASLSVVQTAKLHFLSEFFGLGQAQTSVWR